MAIIKETLHNGLPVKTGEVKRGGKLTFTEGKLVKYVDEPICATGKGRVISPDAIGIKDPWTGETVTYMHEKINELSLRQVVSEKKWDKPGVEVVYRYESDLMEPEKI